MADKIRGAEEAYGAGWIAAAIGIAVENNRRSWSYVEGILRKWGKGEGNPPAGEAAPPMIPEDQGIDRVREREGILESDPKAETVWGLVLDELRSQLPRPTFETWLSSTRGLAFEGEVFIVGVPTSVVIDWLERRMYQAMSKALEKVAERVLDIRFVVVGENQLELASRGVPNSASG